MPMNSRQRKLQKTASTERLLRPRLVVSRKSMTAFFVNFANKTSRFAPPPEKSLFVNELARFFVRWLVGLRGADFLIHPTKKSLFRKFHKNLEDAEKFRGWFLKNFVALFENFENFAQKNPLFFKMLAPFKNFCGGEF